MGQAVNTTVDTTQFDLSSAVPETEDGKAISAMPQFDLSSFTPDPQFQKSTPQSWEDKVVNFIKNPFLMSPDDMQAKENILQTISKSTGMSREQVYDNYDQLSRNPKITGMMPEPTKGQVLGGLMTEGMLAPVAAEGGIAAGALLTTKGLAGLAAFTGVYKLLDTAEDKYLPKDTNQGTKDFLEVPKIIAGAVAGHGIGEAVEMGAEKLVGSFVDNFIPHAPDAVPTMDLAAGHIKAITDSKLPDDAKQDLLDKLGVTQNHIDASIASGKPIRVPLTNVINMAQSPHWDDVAGEITENGLPKTGIETPQAKAIEVAQEIKSEDKSEEILNPRSRPKVQPIWTDDEKSRMGELRDIVSGWKAGGELAPGDQDNGRMIRLPSSFGIKDQGLTQRDLGKLFDRFESGDPLTNKQIKVTKMLLDYHKGSEKLEGDIANATKDVSESEAGEAKAVANQEEPVIQPALDKAWADEGAGEEEQVTTRGEVAKDSGGKVANQKPIESEGKTQKSTLADRIMADVDEKNKNTPDYNRAAMQPLVDKAIELQKTNPDLVERIARGFEETPDGHSTTAIKSAHYMALRDSGMKEEAADAVNRDSLAGTRMGQEVNMYKMYGKTGAEQHDPDAFVRKAVQDRVSKVGKDISGKGSPKEKVFRNMDKDKESLKTKVRQTLSDDDIQKVIDSIICK